jgi:glutamyl-tRNA reductase
MHVPEIRIAMQRFGLLGLSYRTADQGAIARAAARAPSAEAIRKMHDDCGLGESLYLATCNRVEWVIVAPEEVEPGACLHLLERRLQLDPAQCYRLTGEAAARHVFEVAASLDSMNPGETQIVGQVREAYGRASELELVGPRLHLLFEAALRGAKRVRRETALTARPVSMMSLALEAAGELPEGSTVVVVGAGEMARDAAERLAKRRGVELVFVNRTVEKAEALAARTGGRVMPLAAFLAAPPAAAAVISAVSVRAPLLGRAELERLARVGGRRPTLLDLGMPANVDGDAARALDFPLYGMDDLKARGDANRRALEFELAAAAKVVDEELEEFRSAMLERTLAPVLAAWRRRARRTLDEGLQRLFSSEEGRWNEDERERIERWAGTLVDRLAYLPVMGMRKMAAAHGVAPAHTFLSAVGASLEAAADDLDAPLPVPRQTVGP